MFAGEATTTAPLRGSHQNRGAIGPRVGPDGGPPVHDYFDCSRGLSVYPQAGAPRALLGAPPGLVLTPGLFSTRTGHPQEGKIIIFYSMLPNGEMDDYSLHGGGGVLFGHCDAALVEHHSLHFRRLRRPLQQRYQVERQLLALEHPHVDTGSQADVWSSWSCCREVQHRPQNRRAQRGDEEWLAVNR